MKKVIKAVLGTAALLVALGSLGIGIASLVILINVQDVKNNQLGQKSLVNMATDAAVESMLRLLRQPTSFFDNDPLPVCQLKWFYDACLVGASDVQFVRWVVDIIRLQEEYANRSARQFNDMREANPGIGFPALYPGETMGTNSEDLANFLGYSSARSGMNTLFCMGLTIDDKDPHNANGGTTFMVDQPRTLYSASQYPYQDKADIVKDIVDTLISAAILLGIKDVDQNKLREDAEDIAQFDYDLATKYSTDLTTRRRKERSYNPYTIDDLQKLAPFIEWKTFFNKALSPISTTVDGSLRVIVSEVDKLALLSADIISGDISSHTINNYLYYIALINYLPQPVPPHKSESQCLMETKYSALTWANSRLFVDAVYPTPKSRQKIKEEINSFVRSLIAAFRAQIDLIDWMTPASKKGAYKKLDNLVVNVAFPDWILDDSKLTDHYKTSNHADMFNTTPKDDYLDHLDKMTSFELFDDLSDFLAATPIDRAAFPGPAMDVDSLEIYDRNSITIFGGMLHSPLYDSNYPAAVNFGSIGSTAGHEITHGFDDGGVQYDETGVLIKISAKDMDKYSAYQNSPATLKASSNLSVDPCDDFYHYSCGAFPGPKNTFSDLDQANYRIINDKLNDVDYQTTVNASTALSKLQTLYNACKAEAKDSTIGKTNYLDPKVLNFRKYINQDIPLFGGTGKFDLTPENYGNALGYFSFQLGIDTLATPLIDTNWMDPQATQPETKNGYQLFVDQPTTYHVRAFYEDANWDKQKPQYQKTLTTLIEAYAKMDLTAQLPDDYEQMIDEAIELEKTIAIVYSGTDEERRLYLRQWNQRMLNQLPATVDWNKYIKFAPKEAQDWIENKYIIVNEFDKTSDLFTYLANSDASTVINYLFIRLLLANTGLIPCSDGKCASLMRELAVKRAPEHTGKNRVPRHRHPLPAFAPLNEDDANGVGCAEEISVMADAQGRVYIDARFPSDEEKRKIREWVNNFFRKHSTMGVMTNIVDAMKGMIVQLDWMSDDSKANALKKASNIQVNVAYPDVILNNVELDAKYEDLMFDKDDSYYNMLDKITVYSINQQFKLLTAPKADRTDFLAQTAVVNAWYEPELNSITLPARILQQPYFAVNYPAGLNYGGIGVVAGHELNHGFDDEGVQWDFDGRLHSWMNADSLKEFNNMAHCVIDEYSNFCPLPADRSPHCIDGIRTQGENIADNGGIHAAWRAYQSHFELDGPDALFMDKLYAQYTENQLFFLNFAQGWCMQKTYLTESYVSDRLMTDPHPLGPYRVLGTLQNIPAFQTNFNCPKGSTYAPEQHCSVWVPSKKA